MCETREPTTEKIDSVNFYSNYYGHPPKDLQTIISNKPPTQPVIYLVGDSSLDNKHWLPPRPEAAHPNPLYNSLLDGCELRRDIAYWLCEQYTCDGEDSNSGDNTHTPPTFLPLNCAVEATTVRARNSNGLFTQDELVRDNVTSRDVVIACIGGNDIALAPTPRLAFAALRNVFLGGDYGMAALCALFNTSVAKYLSRLVETGRPRLLLVCMVYFPAEMQSPSWAGLTLRLLAYNARPAWLQAAFRRVFARAVSQVQVAGVRVVPVPIYDVLNGKDDGDYVARVEPSEQGGRKIARFLKDIIDRELPGIQAT